MNMIYPLDLFNYHRKEFNRDTQGPLYIYRVADLSIVGIGV